MNEITILRSMVLRIGRGVSASAPLAQAVLAWAEPHIEALTGRPAPEAGRDWPALIAAVAAAPAEAAARPHALELADGLAELLALETFDRALLATMVAVDRLPRVSALARVATSHGVDLVRLLGELAGAEPHDAERRVRTSPVLRFGLIGIQLSRGGELEVVVRWTLERMLDRAPETGDAMVETLIGARQHARLGLDDFADSVSVGFLARLIAGAVETRAEGINILVHGPPGTGKTELARTLAAAAGAALHAIGEADEDGAEPNRWERVAALQLAQRLLAGRGGAVLLFDEMEDLIGETRRGDGDFFAKREGSKVFVNRMLETNPVPVIWTTNAVGNVDPAILRRMSFVMKLDVPSRAAGRRMLARVAAEEGVAEDGFAPLLDAAPEAATVLRVAARAGRIAGEADGGARVAGTLVKALRGGELPDVGGGTLDLSLFESDPPIGPLVERIIADGASDVSLLLTGVPGTGKTALAHHLARALDRPLVVKRASDLLSSWVGATEANIADAFAEARRRDGVLLFDEADSLLFDRTTARTSWEVTQVNELLTWLDRHPLPVVAATNHAARLDPATLRRFVFKLELKPLGRERAAAAFERFFAMPAPASLRAVTGLTPGDFAVVARQLRHLGPADAETIVARLTAEVEVRPSSGGAAIGFGWPRA